MSTQTKEAYMQSLENMGKKRSQWRDVIRRLFRNKLAIVGLILVILVFKAANNFVKRN